MVITWSTDTTFARVHFVLFCLYSLFFPNSYFYFTLPYDLLEPSLFLIFIYQLQHIPNLAYPHPLLISLLKTLPSTTFPTSSSAFLLLVYRSCRYHILWPQYRAGLSTSKSMRTHEENECIYEPQRTIENEMKMSSFIQAKFWITSSFLNVIGRVISFQHPTKPLLSPLCLLSKEASKTNKQQLRFKIKIQYPPVHFWWAEKPHPAASTAVR